MYLVLDKFDKGLYTTTVLSRIQMDPGMCVDAQDVEFYPRGTVTKRKGIGSLTASGWVKTSTTKIYAFDDYTSASVHIAFACSSATVSASATLANVAVNSGVATFTGIAITATHSSDWAPTSGDEISITTWANSAVFTYGWVHPPLMYNGTIGGIAVPMTSAPSAAQVVLAWGDFLICGNILSHRSRIQWNYPGDKDNWPASYYLDLDPDDGDYIVAMHLLADNIVVFKKTKMYVVHWVGGTLLFDSMRISPTVGCVGPNAVLEKNGILYFIANDGIYTFDGSSSPALISSPIDDIVRSINKATDHMSEVFSYDEKSQIWFSVPYTTSKTRNKVLVYDTDLKAWIPFNMEATALGVIAGGALTYAAFPNAYETYDVSLESVDQAGIVCVAGTEASATSAIGRFGQYGLVTSDFGEHINGYWKSIWLDFGDPLLNKRLKRVTAFVESEATTAYDLTMDMWTDWNTNAVSETQNISLSGTSVMNERRCDFTKQFRALQVEFGTALSGQSFSLHKIVFDYDMKGRTMV